MKYTTEPLKGYTTQLALQERLLLSLENYVRSKSSPISVPQNRSSPNRHINLKNGMSDRQRYLNTWVFLKYAMFSSLNTCILFSLTYLNHYLKNGLSTALGEDVIGKSLLSHLRSELVLSKTKKWKGHQEGTLTKYTLSFEA